MRGDYRIKYLPLMTMIIVLVQDPGLLNAVAQARQGCSHQAVRWLLCVWRSGCLSRLGCRGRALGACRGRRGRARGRSLGCGSWPLGCRKLNCVLLERAVCQRRAGRVLEVCLDIFLQILEDSHGRPETGDFADSMRFRCVVPSYSCCVPVCRVQALCHSPSPCVLAILLFPFPPRAPVSLCDPGTPS